MKLSNFKKDLTTADYDLKRDLAIKRKIGRLKFHQKDKTFQEHLGNFAKRSPEFLPSEIIKKKF